VVAGYREKRVMDSIRPLTKLAHVKPAEAHGATQQLPAGVEFGKRSIIAIDTCLGTLSTALWHNGVVAEYHHTIPNQQSSLIADALSDMLARQQCSISNITHAIITNGPGSFTGIRIGLAFLQGLGIEHVYTCDTLTLQWLDLCMPQGIRPLTKLAHVKQVQESHGAQNRSVLNVHEDLSILSDEAIAYRREFPKRSIMTLHAGLNSYYTAAFQGQDAPPKPESFGVALRGDIEALQDQGTLVHGHFIEASWRPQAYFQDPCLAPILRLYIQLSLIIAQPLGLTRRLSSLI
jgi:tRNA threonylcarbamoyl adenosine modification protein YeaZ